ncbi:MAG: hypothetical protein LC744_06000 [Chloroflexi bacterium]|nr:hypothetical protein [Chloroflexota bacterium]
MATEADLRRCIKCGREIGPEESICEFCNRAGMAAPSASQYHGTIVVAIVLGVVGLAIAASFAQRGIGPFVAEVRTIDPADPGYAITYAVTNEGTTPGRAKCRIVAFGQDGEELRARNTVTVQIAGGATAEQTEAIPGLEEEPASASVSCS